MILTIGIVDFTSIIQCSVLKKKQDRQCIHNLTLGRARLPLGLLSGYNMDPGLVISSTVLCGVE